MNWSDVESWNLLGAILKHYVTVSLREISFTKEKYKKLKKTTTQKSNGLRTTLDTTKMCHVN